MKMNIAVDKQVLTQTENRLCHSYANMIFYNLKKTSWPFNRTAMINGVLFLIAIFSFALLSGCEGMNSEFSCPMRPGQMCASVDEVNKMVNQGKIGKKNNMSNVADKSGYPMEIGTLKSSTLTGYPVGKTETGDPLRYGESVMRVWVAPYEGSDGNYYQASTLYTVVKQGHWVGDPVKAINEED